MRNFIKKLVCLSLATAALGTPVVAQSGVSVGNFRLQMDGSCGGSGGSTTFMANVLGSTGPADGPDVFGTPVDFVAFYLVDGADVILGSSTLNAPPNSFLANDVFGTVTIPPTASGNFSFIVHDVTSSAPDQAIRSTYASNGNQMGRGSFNAALLDSDCAVVPADTTPPRILSITRQSPSADTVNTSEVTWRITFSEAVTGVSTVPFSFTGVTIGGSDGTVDRRITAVSASVYDLTVDFDFTPSTVSALRRVAVVNAGGIQDLAGNPMTNLSVSSTNARYAFDLSDPTVTLTPPAAPILPGPVEIEVVFNEIVTGLSAGDFQVTNGSATGLSGSLRNYVVTITPGASNPVTVNLPAGAAQDDVGNGSEAGWTSFSVDPPPMPVISGLAATVGLAADSVTIDFGEEVNGFALTDLSLTNLSASNLQGGAAGLYTFDVVATGDGTGRISLPAGAAQDLAGSDNEAAAEVTTNAVASRPEVTFLRVDAESGVNRYTAIFQVTNPGADGVFGGFPSLTNATSIVGTNGYYGITTSPLLFRVTFVATGGPVAATFPAGNYRDLASSNRSLAAGPIPIGDFDLTPPDVSISGAPGFPGDPYTIDITFTEPVNGFEEADIAGTNAAISDFVNQCGTGFCANYSAVVTANAGSEFAHSVQVPANVAADAAGNPNTASALSTPPPPDGTAPVVTITGLPEGFTGPETATITFDWGEDVFGFEDGDISVTGGTLGLITGGRQVWTAVLNATGDQDVVVTVADAAVQDVTGTASQVASATGAFASADVAEEIIRDFMAARATALIAAQPDLGRLLGSGAPSGSVLVTRGQGDIQLFTGSQGPVWAAVDAQWSEIAGLQTRYTHLTFGAHAHLQDETLLGVMVQLDHAASTEGLAEIEGTGWLIGPYYVADYGGVIVDARALWGRTQNEISPVGTYTNDFATERFLAMVNLSGEIERGAVTLRPLFGWSFVHDQSEAYIDALSNPVAAQTVQLSQVELALDWTMPLAGTQTEFVGGFAGLFTSEEGGNGSTDGLRGRLDLGLRRQGDGPVGFDVGLWADGIGQSGFEAYGVDLMLDIRF